VDHPKRRRARSLLLAAQHQLRQPLNALSLLIGELRQGPSARELNVIADDMRYALQLSNAWLDALNDLEAAEQGMLALDLQAVPLQSIFAALGGDFALRFAELGLAFRMVPTRATVRADPVQLRRLLALLLDNAAKFTPSGKVLLGCRHAGGSLRIEVWDSGPGVPPEQAARVFEPFVRLENEVRPRERGLGLGLAYARRLAELAGDNLSFVARPGRGCCFALTLQPAGSLAGGAAPGDEAVIPANPLAGAEVLLLEGPEATALRASLDSWGAVVRLVAPAGLAAALATAPRLLIADRAAFAAAGGWPLVAAAETAVVLVSERPPERPDPPGSAVHSLLRPVKPARLRALCHFALTRPAAQ